jgi:acyl-CoA thioester hydrolase
MNLEKFRFKIPVEVRFADLDVLGHLNNVTYLTYVEQARILYVREVCGWNGDWRKLGMILARTEVDYKIPVEFDDMVTVYVRTSRIGGKSFDIECCITRQCVTSALEVAAVVKTVMVSYDYEQNSSIPVPQTWRESITAYEPALQ